MGSRSLRDIQQSIQDIRDRIGVDELPDDVRALADELFVFHDELKQRDQSMQGAIVSLVDDMSQTNQTLAETGMRLEGILESAKDVAFIFIDANEPCDAESCRIIEFSRGACDLFGYTREEALALSPAIFFEKGGAPTADNLPTGTRWIMRRKSGELFLALLSIYPLHNSLGEIVARVLIALDLSNQARVEQLFREAHNRYEALALVAPVSIMAFDGNGTITFVNEWHMRVYDNGRIQPELYIGKNICELPSLVRAGVGQTMKQVLKGTSVSLEDVRVPGFGGRQESWQNIRSSPIMEGGTVRGGIIVREEITRRKQTELDLKAVIDNSPIPLIKVKLDASGAVVSSLNPEAVKIFGTKTVGHPLDEFITPVQADDEELAQMHGEWCEMQTREGVRQGIRTVASLGRIDQIHAVMDVSVLIEAKQAAEDANTTRKDFLSNISHEIRTPLNVLLGMLQLLQDTDLGEELNEMTVYAVGAGHSLLALLNDILDFTTMESSSVCADDQLFNLPDLVNMIALPYTMEAKKKGLKLTVRLDNDVPETLTGDPRRLRQCLFHLIGNSVKFTDQGNVVVRVSNAGPGTEEKRRQIAFLISDTGIGIDEETMAVIFEPFRQGDGSRTRRHGGTGIGLALVQEFARIMGGSIRLTSKPGRGTQALLTVDAGVS